MTFFEWFECIDYQEVRYYCEIGFGSRGSWVRIPSPRQSFKTVGYQDNMNLKANGFFSCLDVSFSLLFVNLRKLGTSHMGYYYSGYRHSRCSYR